jgi:hypothetical protein
VRIPASRSVREDLHSLSRVVTRAGNISYRAQYTPDGHADRAMALALAIRGAAQVRPRCDIEHVPNTSDRWTWCSGSVNSSARPSVKQRERAALEEIERRRWGLGIPWI